MLNNNKTNITAQITKGEGDCAFHAALGIWSGTQYECNDIAGERKKLANYIRTCNRNSPAFKYIKEAIKEIIREQTTIKGAIFKQVQEQYKNYRDKSQKQEKNVPWETFASELNKHSDIVEHINNFIKNYCEEKKSLLKDQINNRLIDKFYTCLNEDSDDLKHLIFSITDLDNAYKIFTKASENDFDWDNLFNGHLNSLVQQYAAHIQKPGIWMLPCEVALIAYCFDTTINYYNNNTLVDTFNPGQSTSVSIAFNGVDHYERRATPINKITQNNLTNNSFGLSELKSDTSYKATLKGDIFQLKLLMSVAWRAMKNGQSFMLNTEVTAAEKFDDLVIEYSDQVTVLQAKHTAKPNNYALNDFIQPKKGEASLAKYFDSFVNLEEKKSSLFPNKNINYVFFTNRTLADDVFKKSLNIADISGDNLKFKSANSQCWKFKPDFFNIKQDYQETHKKLKDTIQSHSSIYYHLLSANLKIDMAAHQAKIQSEAKKVIKYILESMESKKIDFNRKCAKSRNLLISILDSKKDNELVFSERFLTKTTLKPFEDWFYKELINQAKEKFKLEEKDLIKKLGEVELIYPKKVIEITWEPKDKKKPSLVTIKTTNNQPTFQPDENTSFCLVGMFGDLSFDYQIDFDCPLINLTCYQTFKTAVLNALKKSAPQKTQEIDQKFDQYLKDFYQAFHIIVGQPSEEELEKIIQEEIKVSLNFSGEEYYDSFQREMLNWMKGFEGKPIDNEKMQQFFKQVSCNIERLHLIGYSEHLLAVISKKDLRYSSEVLKSMHDFIQPNNQNAILVVTSQDSNALTFAASQTIYECKNQSILEKDNWAFVDYDCGIIAKIPEVLAKANNKLVIVDHVEKLLSSDILVRIIKNAITSKKKVILLCHENGLKTLQEKLPTDQHSVYQIPLLKDQDVRNHLEKYKNQFLNLGGRHVEIQTILENPNSGIFQTLKSPSLLIQLQENFLSDRTNQTQSAIYIPQAVKEHAAIYSVSQILNELPKHYLLKITKVQAVGEITKKTSGYIKLNFSKIIKYSQEKTEDKDLDAFNIFQFCCEDDIKDIEIENLVKTANLLIIIDVSEKKLLKHSRRMIQYLCELYRVVLISSEDEIKFEYKNSVTSIYNDGNLDIGYEQRSYFGKPDFKNETMSQPGQYDSLKLLHSQPYSLTTCFGANPGTGKSEGFREQFRQWLNLPLSENYYHWVVIINMNDINRFYPNDNIINMLINILCENPNIGSINTSLKAIWANALEHDIKHNKVKLFLDGWDEVKDENKKTLIKKFINELPKGIHFDIATRPYAFDSVPCSIHRYVQLQNFTDKDLKNYLTQSFQKQKFNYDQEDINKKLNPFLKACNKWIGGADSDLKEIVNIPLMAYLLAESLQSYWEAWLKSHDELLSGPWDDEAELNTITLYETYMMQRSRIYLQKHQSSQIENSRSVINLTQRLREMMIMISFYEMFSLVLPKQFSITNEDYYDLLDFGIIINRQFEPQAHGLGNYRYIFIHQTFKELFTALYIVQALNLPRSEVKYQQVVSLLATMRYEKNYKVVWQFVKHLSIHGSIFLNDTMVIEGFLDPLKTSNDLIGVANINLLQMLGYKDTSIKTNRLKIRIKSNFSDTDESLVPDNKATEVLEQLKKNFQKAIKLNDKDEIISLLSKIPESFSNEETENYIEILSKTLSSWWYRIKGHAAYVLSKLNLTLSKDIFLAKLVNVVYDKNCHESERCAAIIAMLKINISSYDDVWSSYKEILQNTEIPLRIKATIYRSLERMIGECSEITKIQIDTFLFEGTKIVDQKDGYSEEINLRELFLLKLTRKEICYFKNKPTLDLARMVADKLNLHRLNLLITLHKNDFIDISKIKDAIIRSIVDSDNRNIALELIECFYNFLNKDNKDINYLATALSQAKIDLPQNSIVNVYEQIDKFQFESQKTHAYWRVDAGIPIACFFMSDKYLRGVGYGYLLYQIRKNFREYSVEYTVINFLLKNLEESSFKDHVDRAMILNIYCEFLMSCSMYKHSVLTQSMFRNDFDLLKKLIDTAWQHFTSRRCHPLLGLDLMFCLGVFYGLPLIHTNNTFQLLLINTGCAPIKSPELSSKQIETVKEHFSALQELYNKNENSLQSLRDINNRISLKINADLIQWPNTANVFLPPPAKVKKYKEDTDVMDNFTLGRKLDFSN